MVKINLNGKLNEKLESIVPVSKWLAKAEETFEKNAGWNRKHYYRILTQFSRLNRMDQLLFGGLLVGEALVGKRFKAPAVKRVRKPKLQTTVETPVSAEAEPNVESAPAAAIA